MLNVWQPIHVAFNGITCHVRAESLSCGPVASSTVYTLFFVCLLMSIKINAQMYQYKAYVSDTLSTGENRTWQVASGLS